MIFGNYKRGMTGLQYLIVLAIIAILIMLSFVSMEASREAGRNSARVSQIQEYRKALAIYNLSEGHYPTFSNGAKESCLGVYDGGVCWQSSESVKTEPELVSALTPKYMLRLADGETIKFGQGSGEIYTGIVYVDELSGRSYSIKYFMEGHKPCVLENTIATSVGNDTLCVYTYVP